MLGSRARGERREARKVDELEAKGESKAQSDQSSVREEMKLVQVKPVHSYLKRVFGGAAVPLLRVDIW